MSTSIHLIIILSDSNVEDAFSSTNTPNYTPASLKFSPASLGNTSSDSSKDLSKDLLASLTISPFHDDPYMKVMQAYNATSNESPIPLLRAPIAPPTVLPLPPTGESSHVTRLERHEEKIETILNHLDELPLERIEHMEDKIEGLGNGRDFYSRDAHRGYPDSPPIRYEESLDTIHELKNHKGGPPDYYTRSLMAPKRTSTSAAPAKTQAAIKKLVVDSVAVALEAQAATMANTDNTNRNTGQRETPVQFSRTSLTRFLAQRIRSSNAIALDSPYLLVLITGTSQSRQHGKSESDSYYLSD
ncbi:hypothetical protein Tco_0610166 [Tanacetum coccineum]